MYKKDELKVGDWVKVSTNMGFRKRQIIDETPTLWKIDGLRFRKSDGRMPGTDAWNMSYISAWTEEDQKQLIEQIRLGTIKKVLNTIGLLNPAEVAKEDAETLARIAEKYSKG